MDINSLTDFITLAECKSFSRAAALRHITQPAFSRRIQALEISVGIALLDRASKSFKLTAAGKRFLLHAKNLVAMADDAVSDAQSVMTRLADPVYLVAPSFISKTFFPPWYRNMQRAVAGLTVRVSHQTGSGAIGDLRKSLADFALVLRAKRIDPCYDFSGLQSRIVGQDHMLAVCASFAKNTSDLLMYERGSYMSACAEALLGKHKGKTVFESNSTGLLKEMALAGFGTAMLHESMIADDLAQGYLKPAFEHKPLTCDILLVRGKEALSKKAEGLWVASA